MTDDAAREQAARDIALAAKRLRKPLPRWLWIIAAVIGTACTIAAAVAWTARGDATVSSIKPRSSHVGPGFGMGIGIGLGGGLVIGFAIGRRRHRSSPSLREGAR